MKVFKMLIKNNEEKVKQQQAFDEFVKVGGFSEIRSGAKYIGGHAAVTGEMQGDLSVNGSGLFFNGSRNGYFFIPVEKITNSEFNTGEAVSKNPFFSRLFAIGGFTFAYKNGARNKHMFLTITYIESGVENNVLFETEEANRFSSVIAKLRQELQKKKTDGQKTIMELMKEVNEMRALGILTSEEFIIKKKELLSRM